ncbi:MULTISPECIES: hypothetical protein [Mycobacteriaceae]|uniref:hypothetical protein n=1 Tax=Mycobacteriaceae TaxID=1762 RepID=UPI001F0BBBE6|nr:MULTISPECIES: hypothetical protein [Mycobacteriaceae]MDV3136710.1 hypothetical protein [Mycobacterium sp. 29Ha]WSE55932.1 hypothetical protein QGN32_21635 [Mycolicibacterium sp. ND9-15]
MTVNDTADATFAFVDLAGFVVLTEICGDRQAARLAGRLSDLPARRPGRASLSSRPSMMR